MEYSLAMNDKSTYCWRDNNDKVQSLRVTGHRLLVRKTAKPDSDYILEGPDRQIQTPDFLNVSIGAILGALTEDTSHNICEVLAVGPDCGKPRTKKERKRLGLKGQTVFEGKVGDFVVLPEHSPNLFNGVTGKPYDILVDEGELLLVMSQDDDDDRNCLDT